MVTKHTLEEWLEGLTPDNVNVATDDGGLTLVGLDREGNPTGEYLEIGGVPTNSNPDEEEEVCSFCGSGLFNDTGECQKCGM